MLFCDGSLRGLITPVISWRYINQIFAPIVIIKLLLILPLMVSSLLNPVLILSLPVSWWRSTDFLDLPAPFDTVDHFLCLIHCVHLLPVEQSVWIFSFLAAHSSSVFFAYYSLYVLPLHEESSRFTPWVLRLPLMLFIIFWLYYFMPWPCTPSGGNEA